MALTREQVQALIAASERTTDGPWEAIGDSDDEVYTYADNYGDVAVMTDQPNKLHDAEWIVQSRNLVPQLAEEWKQQKDEIEQKDAENRRLREVLNQAEGFISAMIAFYGRNLEVANWHMNGDTEPWDNFIDENGGHETLDAVRQALADIDAGSGADVGMKCEFCTNKAQEKIDDVYLCESCVSDYAANMAVARQMQERFEHHYGGADAEDGGER